MDEDYVRRLLLELKKQLSSADEGYEKSLAADRLEELQQAFYQVKIKMRGSGSTVKNKNVVDKARSALLELGSTKRQTDAIVQHLLNRGVIDATVEVSDD